MVMAYSVAAGSDSDRVVVTMCLPCCCRCCSSLLLLRGVGVKRHFVAPLVVACLFCLTVTRCVWELLWVDVVGNE